MINLAASLGRVESEDVYLLVWHPEHAPAILRQLHTFSLKNDRLSGAGEWNKSIRDIRKTNSF